MMETYCTINRRNNIQNFVCERIAYDRELCILHSDNNKKDQNLFHDELKRTLEDSSIDVIDLRNVIFVGGYELFRNRIFSKKILFDNSQFILGVPTFIDVKFDQKCSFRHVSFNTGVKFASCIFNEIADFNQVGFLHQETIFEAVRFFDKAVFFGSTFSNATRFREKCIFSDGADFSGVHVRANLLVENCVFDGPLTFNNSLIESSVLFRKTLLNGHNSFLIKQLKNYTFNFDEVTFFGQTDFGEDKFSNIPPSFHRCDMKEVKILQLPILVFHNGVSKVQVEKCTWPKKNYLFIRGRDVTADEKYRARPFDLLKLYKYLHRRYFESSEYQQAIEFYVGFMIQKRKLQKGEWFAKLIDGFYSIFSRYGESISRPFWALIVMWLIVPILLLQLGIKLDSPDVPETKFPFVNLTDYFRTVSLNLQLSTLVRSSELRPQITSWQSTILFFETVLNGLFLGFFALGIRRRSVPRKPIE